MRKLKLQMQITADGFVAGPEGQLDWMTRNMDEKLQQLITQLTNTSDTILLGRKMAPGFVRYWEHEITEPEGSQFAFGQKMSQSNMSSYWLWAQAARTAVKSQRSRT